MSTFITGFQSLDKETAAIKLSLQGQLPLWLQGSLYRNGPAKFEAGPQKMHHWFDGFAMIQRFHFQNGEIFYTNKFLQSDAYISALSKNKVCYDEFATSPKNNVLQRLISFLKPPLTDNTNVNIIPWQDNLLALTETCQYLSFQAENLQTIKHEIFQDNLKGVITTAHPHFDYHKGLIYNFTVEIGPKCYYHIYALPRGQLTRQLLTRIAIKSPAYMHSFAMTNRYLIIIEPPLKLNKTSLILRRRPYIENYFWEKETGTRFIIIDKNTGDTVGEFMTEPFFFFHQINAYEDAQTLVIDLPVFSDATIINALYLANVNEVKFPQAIPTRYRIDLNKKNIKKELLQSDNAELPRIHYAYSNTKEYQYFYACHSDQPGNFLNQLIKIDVSKGISTIWQATDCYPGEPVFISRPGSQVEDDGIIASLVLDGKQGFSFLLLLDATNFQEIARAPLQTIIPFGFHGIFRHSVAL